MYGIHANPGKVANRVGIRGDAQPRKNHQNNPWTRLPSVVPGASFLDPLDFHKQRYKQYQVHPQPHSPVTWSPPLDFCFRTSWGSYRTCPVGPVGQLGPGYGPVMSRVTVPIPGVAVHYDTRELRATQLGKPEHCIGTADSMDCQFVVTLWWSQMFAKQNMFNDSLILKW